MYRSALAFEKELEQGFQPSFAFPHFEALVVIFPTESGHIVIVQRALSVKLS